MSVSSKINDSTRHFMVLHAIATGLDTIEKIAAAIRKSEETLRCIKKGLEPKLFAINTYRPSPLTAVD